MRKALRRKSVLAEKPMKATPRSLASSVGLRVRSVGMGNPGRMSGAHPSRVSHLLAPRGAEVQTGACSGIGRDQHVPGLRLPAPGTSLPWETLRQPENPTLVVTRSLQSDETRGATLTQRCTYMYSHVRDARAVQDAVDIGHMPWMTHDLTG